MASFLAISLVVLKIPISLRSLRHTLYASITGGSFKSKKSASGLSLNMYVGFFPFLVKKKDAGLLLASGVRSDWEA